MRVAFASPRRLLLSPRPTEVQWGPLGHREQLIGPQFLQCGLAATSEKAGEWPLFRRSRDDRLLARRVDSVYKMGTVD